MIDVCSARAALFAVPGDHVVFTKAQVAEMLTEVELGQHARRAVINLNTLTAIAASKAGAPA